MLPAHFSTLGRRSLNWLSAAVVFLSFPVFAEDWPQFRGPTAQGHSTEHSLPTEWSSTNNVAWKQSIPGQGWSSPVYRQNRIYLTTAVSPESGPGNISLRVLALDAKSGRILWNEEAFSHDTSTGIHSKNSHASPTPIADDGRIYVHFGHQGTACLNEDGRFLWRNNSFKYSPIHGNGGSPILIEDKLIFSADGGSNPFLVALNKDTGEVIWKTERQTPAKNKFSFSTPLLISVEGSSQLISPGSGLVGAYDPQSGKELWRVRYGEGYSVVPRPVFGRGLIFIGTGYDRPTVMAIRPGGAGDTTESHVAWTLTRGAPNTPSLILVGDELYMVSDGGIASCLDAKTGTVHWQERLGGNYSASPLFADGKLYFQSEDGTGSVLKPGKEFVVLAKNSLNERTLASYAVADKALFIRTAEHLYRIQQQ